MIFFTTPALCGKNYRIVINSFGATNIPLYLERGEHISSLDIPIRDDGAKFLGWYYSLNFDDKFKVDESKDLEYVIINARFDKCYCFSLRYNVLGCFGKTNNEKIEYFIPSGSYKVTFTDFSNSKEGKITILNSNNEIIKEISFNKIKEVKNIIINEEEHVLISSDSVFEFQRNDVDSKYVNFRMD